MEGHLVVDLSTVGKSDESMRMLSLCLQGLEHAGGGQRRLSFKRK